MDSGIKYVVGLKPAFIEKTNELKVGAKTLKLDRDPIAVAHEARVSITEVETGEKVEKYADTLFQLLKSADLMDTNIRRGGMAMDAHAKTWVVADRAASELLALAGREGLPNDHVQALLNLAEEMQQVVVDTPPPNLMALGSGRNLHEVIAANTPEPGDLIEVVPGLKERIDESKAADGEDGSAPYLSPAAKELLHKIKKEPSE